MNWFEKIVYWLQGEMPEPGNYGWFHLMYIGIMIGLTVFLCIKFRNCSDKTFRIIALIAWIVMLVLEIYKQIVFSFEYEGGVAKWDYQWYAFPFQLCSTPIYILPFIIFLKEGQVRDACIAFMGTFAMFGGLVTFIYPNDVFIEMIGINIQTMTHHGLQIALGIFFLVHNREKLNIKFFLKGVIVFGTVCAIALVSDIIMYHVIDETFNMFYISPYTPCTLPLLSMLYPLMPYILFLLMYIIGFTLAGLVIFYIQYGIIKLVQKKSKKNEQVSA